MKKILVLLLAVMLLSACGTQKAVSTPEPTPEPTPVPTVTPTPEPEWKPGTVRLDGAGAVYTTLDRGAELEVIGTIRDYYVVSLDDVKLLVEKRFLRLDSEAAPEAREAYAGTDCEVFSDVYMQGEAGEVLALNTQVTILEELGNCILIEYDGKLGYVNADALTSSPTQIYYYGGGGSSGGSSGGGGGAPTTGADGGDIVLSLKLGLNATLVFMSYMDGGIEPMSAATGMILADGVELYLDIFTYNDTVKVVSVDGDICTVLVNGNLGTMSKWMLRLSGEEAYMPWTGYASNSPVLYDNYKLSGTGTELVANAELTVLDEFEGVYLVRYEEQIAFISKDSISTDPVVYSYYGGGDGGYSGGGSSSGGGGGGSEWTEPVL